MEAACPRWMQHPCQHFEAFSRDPSPLSPFSEHGDGSSLQWGVRSQCTPRSDSLRARHCEANSLMTTKSVRNGSIIGTDVVCHIAPSSGQTDNVQQRVGLVICAARCRVLFVGFIDMSESAMTSTSISGEWQYSFHLQDEYVRHRPAR
jgi:hypothetical protein